ncbi:unnamed protein product [Moneuplotes crassus]|uniref:Uncharacterized protein n=1 Tax=Euplotes crassus TaxID=5936 RepID=A0AAD1XV37_EUPCR|nr:unnamed protein product [Moneuplotes crassus]
MLILSGGIWRPSNLSMCDSDELIGGMEFLMWNSFWKDLLEPDTDSELGSNSLACSTISKWLPVSLLCRLWSLNCVNLPPALFQVFILCRLNRLWTCSEFLMLCESLRTSSHTLRLALNKASCFDSSFETWLADMSSFLIINALLVCNLFLLRFLVFTNKSFVLQGMKPQSSLLGSNLFPNSSTVLSLELL